MFKKKTKVLKTSLNFYFIIEGLFCFLLFLALVFFALVFREKTNRSEWEKTNRSEWIYFTTLISAWKDDKTIKKDNLLWTCFVYCPCTFFYMLKKFELVCLKNPKEERKIIFFNNVSNNHFTVLAIKKNIEDNCFEAFYFDSLYNNSWYNSFFNFHSKNNDCFSRLFSSLDKKETAVFDFVFTKWDSNKVISEQKNNKKSFCSELSFCYDVGANKFFGKTTRNEKRKAQISKTFFKKMTKKKCFVFFYMCGPFIPSKSECGCLPADKQPKKGISRPFLTTKLIFCFLHRVLNVSKYKFKLQINNFCGQKDSENCGVFAFIFAKKIVECWKEKLSTEDVYIKVNNVRLNEEDILNVRKYLEEVVVKFTTKLS